ncbi:MAG: TRAP transporter small permease subunit [Proteobacteria bacterium]|nr:TRAP transporter small permease subunit [Pseudomonadota bacterium]
MNFIDRLTAAIDGFVTFAGRMSSWLAIGLMLSIILDVISRSQGFTIVSSTKLQELEWHFHGSLFLLCMGFAYLKDAHVRIEIIRDKMKTRTRVWIELFGALLFVIPYSIIVIYWGFTFADMAWNTGETSAQSGLSDRWIIKGMIPAGFFFLLLAGIAVALKCILYLFGPEHLRQHAAFIAETHHADLIEAGEEPRD